MKDIDWEIEQRTIAIDYFERQLDRVHMPKEREQMIDTIMKLNREIVALESEAVKIF